MTYKYNNLITEASEFAKSLKYSGKMILDLGCGNGRDTTFFKTNNNALGVDLNPPSGWSFVKDDVENYLNVIDTDSVKIDVVYCRFFLHSISEELETKIIKWSFDNAKEIAIETRIIGDKPLLYQDHERRFINPPDLIKKLLDTGFKELDIKVGYGMAKLREEDPYVMRIVAKKV